MPIFDCHIIYIFLATAYGLIESNRAICTNSTTSKQRSLLSTTAIKDCGQFNACASFFGVMFCLILASFSVGITS